MSHGSVEQSHRALIQNVCRYLMSEMLSVASGLRAPACMTYVSQQHVAPEHARGHLSDATTV